jgi:hypothetical protein
MSRFYTRQAQAAYFMVAFIPIAHRPELAVRGRIKAQNKTMLIPHTLDFFVSASSTIIYL